MQREKRKGRRAMGDLAGGGAMEMTLEDPLGDYSVEYTPSGHHHKTAKEQGNQSSGNFAPAPVSIHSGWDRTGHLKPDGGPAASSYG